MQLTELAPVPAAVLPLAAFREHLRLGVGFSDDGVQDALAESYVRAAIAAIEGRIGKALLARDFLLEVDAWRDPGCQALPLAPVSAVVTVTLRDAGGQASLAPATAWRLVPDRQRPKLAGTGGVLPAIPPEGAAEILFTAGFGPAWPDVPADLGQAVFLLAAQYFETRHEGSERAAALPFGVTALIERWRTVRVLAGGGA